MEKKKLQNKRKEKSGFTRKKKRVYVNEERKKRGIKKSLKTKEKHIIIKIFERLKKEKESVR